MTHKEEINLTPAENGADTQEAALAADTAAQAAQENAGAASAQETPTQQVAREFSAPAPAAPVPPVPPQPPASPAQPVQSMAPQPPVQQLPVRRVGSITAGLALIVAGVLMCISLLRPNMDLVLLILKCTPLLLVFLGIEILFSRVASSRVRIKYDFLSVIMVFFVLCAAAGSAFMPVFLEYYGPERNNLQNKLNAQWENAIYEQLKSLPDVDGVHTQLYLNEFKSGENINGLADVTELDYMNAEVRMSGDYADAAAFAKACEPVVQGVLAAGGGVDSVRMYTAGTRANERDGDVNYALSLDGKYRLAKTAQEWEDMVEVEYYVEGYGRYMTQAEKESYELEEARIQQEMEAQEEAQRRIEEEQRRMDEAQQEAESRIQAAMNAANSLEGTDGVEPAESNLEAA